MDDLVAALRALAEPLSGPSVSHVAELARASREPQVRTARASVGPDNAPSRTLILAHGFAEVGEQWDEEDGLEIIFERPV